MSTYIFEGIPRQTFEAMLPGDLERVERTATRRYFRPGPYGSYYRDETIGYDYHDPTSREIVASWTVDHREDCNGLLGNGRIV